MVAALAGSIVAPPAMGLVCVTTGRGGLNIQSREVVAPRYDEVLVEVRYCGICGSDYRDIGRFPEGICPGHEVDGEVVARGANVPISLLGQKVALYPGAPCGQCSDCATGREHTCEYGSYLGDGGGKLPGGFAQFVTVPARCCVMIPEGLSMEAAALAEATAVVFRTIRLVEGMLSAAGGQLVSTGKYKDKFLVLGGGALAQLSLLVLRERHPEHEVVLLARSPQECELAVRLSGATTGQLSSANPRQSIRENTRILQEWRRQALFAIALEMTGADRILLSLNRSNPTRSEGAQGGVGIYDKDMCLTPRNRRAETRGALVRRCNKPEAIAEALEFLLRHQDLVQQLIGPTISLSHLPAWFEQNAHKSRGGQRVLVDCAS